MPIDRLVLIGAGAGCGALAIFAGVYRARQARSGAQTTFNPELRSKLESSFAVKAAGGALLLGALLAAGGYWQFTLKPMRDAARVRAQAQSCLMRLYTLQMMFYQKHHYYANDLPPLLTASPDPAKMREKLAKVVDLNTIAVIGDSKHFRLEVNALDPERTPIKTRGPLTAE